MMLAEITKTQEKVGSVIICQISSVNSQHQFWDMILVSFENDEEIILFAESFEVNHDL